MLYNLSPSERMSRIEYNHNVKIDTYYEENLAEIYVRLNINRSLVYNFLVSDLSNETFMNGWLDRLEVELQKPEVKSYCNFREGVSNGY